MRVIDVRSNDVQQIPAVAGGLLVTLRDVDHDVLFRLDPSSEYVKDQPAWLTYLLRLIAEIHQQKTPKYDYLTCILRTSFDRHELEIQRRSSE